MVRIIESSVFTAWLTGLRDARARNRVLARISRLTAGNPGDVKPVGQGISELRIDYGPGYRVYFSQRGVVAILLLVGGNKRTQDRDIKRAKDISKAFESQETHHGEEGTTG